MPEFIGPPSRYNRDHTNPSLFKRCDFCSFPIDVNNPEHCLISKDGRHFILPCNYCYEQIYKIRRASLAS